ncbi:4-hydroxy-tetrahydrodipicolinate reductase [Haloferax mediterranei ATCC 33500]|uniref:4-hydroxy-tetrahydrodipicolinate reductase n=1 Tax=Haloferax mediterranei (strain ATCC 33500 / DSM 1411 / JCM 8866 / NBRC 14739 / NCIMB 2177 / R-4) TaxID=523841 RepID=I3R3L4_HALMT|nr:4-hydroxy-tetrahydrodipicolinate reductase [Haloferax mediterranei]AFK18824.1 dihydrodipicolinate reductase [Haloferax mediterranei ATCC 33500]EMA03318.1 dihydrodipicolinate reductase [Haloferax mediterranei ATCC 33500]MDX5988917.1 4-hydroxy-tetrahydrodipicolinate reductase [Haloferax mediterranei ATCC 33500]QCQ75315.1 4-hydroxy-tetrahydrodipicolinate reductase [Haloferax mediterranei ATCC 33500]
MTVTVGVTGATGRMGEEVLAAAADRDDLDVAFAVSRSPGAEVEGVTVEDAADLPDLLAENRPDVLVDFTGPSACIEVATACAEAGVAFVSGTTGLSEGGFDALREAAEEVPVLYASNFSRGIAALRRAVREAVPALDGYDIELTETHHNAKRDAPSGTALTLLEDIDEARGDSPRVHGREGEAPRSEEEIGVHARRAGDIAGEHEVLLAGNHESLLLTHRAGSRGVFAAGALDAAAWVSDRDAGWYDFTEVLE